MSIRSTRTGAKMKIFHYLDDILILIGEALVVAGAYQFSLTAALFTAGTALIIDGVVIGLSRSKNDHS